MGKSQFENYYGYVGEQASDFVGNHFEEVLESIRDGNTDVFTFMDEYVWQWVDNDFIYVDLLDSAHILDQSNNVETDSGLWEGLEPTKAVESQAFFTYKNDLMIAVGEELKDRLESKGQEIEKELEGLQDDLDEIKEEDEEEIGEVQEKIEELESFIYNVEEAIGNL